MRKIRRIDIHLISISNGLPTLNTEEYPNEIKSLEIEPGQVLKHRSGFYLVEKDLSLTKS
jgi:hypothetical protein